MVSHEHHELCIVFKTCSLGQLWNKISTSLRSSSTLFQNIDWEFLDAPIDGVVQKPLANLLAAAGVCNL